MNQLKLSLFLPAEGETQDLKVLTVSRDTLEIGTQYAVSIGDTAMFERYMAQLQTYYYDFSTQLPESPYKYVTNNHISIYRMSTPISDI